MDVFQSDEGVINFLFVYIFKVYRIQIESKEPVIVQHLGSESRIKINRLIDSHQPHFQACLLPL